MPSTEHSPAQHASVSVAQVRLLAIYPVKDEPGERLRSCQVEPDGLAGDRRKKSPVHLVGLGHTPESTRANIFLDLDDDALRALVGSDARLGRSVLRITKEPSACPGVYADVVTPGTVNVGDELKPG